jgi:hypothetical protein
VKRSLVLLIAALAALGALGIGAGNAFAATPTFFNGFEADTSGWFNNNGTIARVTDGYVSSSYASGISSAPDATDPGLLRHHARLSRGSCGVDLTGGGGPTVYCTGPFTRWGGYNSDWTGGYTTQVDVYLDVAYASANPDSYGGAPCLTTSPSDPLCKGTRFDYSSAINNASGTAGLRDFVFTVGTGPYLPVCPTGGFVAAAGTNAYRSGATPYTADAHCIATTGWYTFRHTFKDVSGALVVDMDILPQGTTTPVAHWQITSGDRIADVGCNRYGWFVDQEIQELAIDNSRMEGCGLATLVVQKACNPTADPGTFNLQVDGASVGTAAGCGQSRSTNVTPGSHTVSETAGAGTSLADYDSVTGGACASDGSITLTAGQTATCTITNTRKATLTVTKACNPTTDGGHFNLLVDNTTVAANAACAGSGSIKLSPGNHTVSETAAGTTVLSDYDSVTGGACASDGSITLTAGQTATCTITNTRKPKITVTKTCPNGKQSSGDRFEVVNNGTRTGYILDCGESTTFLVAAGSPLNVTEAVPDGNKTTNLANYRFTRSAGCTSTALPAGATVACTITNTLIAPRTQALSAGYWKNHPMQMQPLLPVTLGDFPIASTNDASKVFNAMNCSSTKDQDAVGCLEGQLLAAKLNVKNGASNCINTVIAQADALLVAIGYHGPGKYTLTTAQRTQLISLKNALDKYNNGLGC